MEAKQKKLTTKRQSLISDTVAASTAVEFGSVEAEAQQFANVVMDGRRIVESISSWKEVLCLLCSQGWCFRDIVKARVNREMPDLLDGEGREYIGCTRYFCDPDRLLSPVNCGFRICP